MHAMPLSADIPSEPAPTGSQVGVGVASLVAAAAAVIPLAVMALAGPKFMDLFKDFGVALPASTLWMINLGSSLASPLGVVFMLLLGAGVAGLVCMAWRTRWVLGLAILLACIIWFCVSLGIIVVSLYFPLVAMIESLQQSGTP